MTLVQEAVPKAVLVLKPDGFSNTAVQVRLNGTVLCEWTAGERGCGELPADPD
ncbi:MAG: hypothetical protein HY093_03045 [Candidatus Liptonbacteria bacterium]|nr:hypothetical protein [Candidatus Liptonbacteria bacterium]